MYKIRFGFYNSEKAAKKRYTCVHFQNSAVFILQDGENLKKFAKSIDADPSHLENLTRDEVNVVENYLKQQKLNSTAQTQQKLNSAAQPQQKASTSVETKPKVESANMADFKVQFKAPKIDLSSDDTVENSIRALRAANDMKLMSEQQLIYSSLIESDCMHLFAVLTTEQKTTVADFCSYLLQAYGSAVNHYSRFERIKQEPTENFNNFLARIKCSYAALTGKSIVNFDENDRKIIVSKFVEAVCDNTVSAELTKVFSNLSLQTVAASAKNISTAIKKTPVMEVNAVDRFDRRDSRNRSSSRDRRRSSSRGRDYRNRSSSRDRQRSSSRDRKRVSWSSDSCLRCGKQGHFVQECQASWKTVRDFRRKLDSNHQ